MKFKDIILKGLYQSLGLTAYCIFIAFVMDNLSAFLSNTNAGITNLWYSFIFLTIFIISALITGSIALAYPIFLATKKRFREAWSVVFSTIAWLVIFFLISLIVIIIIL
jgi:phage-related protein